MKLFKLYEQVEQEQSKVDIILTKNLERKISQEERASELKSIINIEKAIITNEQGFSKDITTTEHRASAMHDLNEKRNRNHLMIFKNIIYIVQNQFFDMSS